MASFLFHDIFTMFIIQQIRYLTLSKSWKLLSLVYLLLCLGEVSFATPKKHAYTIKKIPTHYVNGKKQYSKKILTKKNYPKLEVTHTQLTFKPKSTLYQLISNSIALPETKQVAKEHEVVKFVHNTVSNLTYSTYKLGGAHFDMRRGIYIVDCSIYVDRVLKATQPIAFSRLASWSGNANPTTNDYYQYFKELSDNNHTSWRPIQDVEALRPGDIIVFRYKRNTKGHIMIVMDKPTRHKNTYALRVTDSAPVGHSQDTRSRRVSGIGIGTMMLKIDSKSYRPYAYAWQIGAPWKNNVAFAMARPIDSTQTMA